MKQLTKEEGLNVLKAWTALEVLSPQSFTKIESLAGGDPLLVVFLDKGLLPWQKNKKEIKPKIRLFYQIIIGTINLEKAFQALINKYGENGVEETISIQGEAIMGLVTVDHDGYLIKDSGSVSISSFAWGVPQALDDTLENLSNWSAVESDMLRKFYSTLLEKDETGKILPLTKSALDNAYHCLIESLKIPEYLTINKKFAIKKYEPLSSNEPPQPLLLNSFYLGDLARAKSLIAQDQASENLQRYLGMKSPSARHNILNDDNVLENIIAPKNIFPSRWPGPGRQPLVLLQQAAVNVSMSELKNDGILAINGPPGTGKTTLLRDIIAGIITKRAKALSEFDDPATAFTDVYYKIRAGKGFLRLHKLDDKLKGFEVVIASSNNKAVENISIELPNLKSIASDADELRYFSTLSDQLIGGPTWGLIAAVLGNSANRNRFRQKFWWDGDFGLSTYLARAAGIPQLIDIKDLEPVTQNL